MSMPARELDQTQRAALAAVMEKWMDKTFYPARARAGFKQDCRVCSDIVWDLEIAVDAGGHVDSLDVTGSIVDCPSKSAAEIEDFERNVLAGLRATVFPEQLRSLTFAARFGQVTRC